MDGQGVVWHPIFRRAAFDREIPRLAQLLARLQNNKVHLGEEDRRVWLGDPGGKFSVKACYAHFVNIEEDQGPWGLVWYNTVPLKIRFFLWTVALDKVLTMDVLQRKGLLTSICLLCYQNAESSDHIFLHCPFSWEVWCGCTKDFGASFIAPQCIKDLLIGWKLNAFNVFGRRLWKVVSAAICWAVWSECNNRVFRGHSEPAYMMYRRSMDLIIFWAKRCKGFDGLPNGTLVRD